MLDEGTGTGSPPSVPTPPPDVVNDTNLFIDWIETTFSEVYTAWEIVANRQWYCVFDIGTFSVEALRKLQKFIDSWNEMASDNNNAYKTFKAVTSTMDLVKMFTMGFPERKKSGEDASVTTLAMGHKVDYDDIPLSTVSWLSVYVQIEQSIDITSLGAPDPKLTLKMPWSEVGVDWDLLQPPLIKDLRIYFMGIDVWNFAVPGFLGVHGWWFPIRFLLEAVIIVVAVYIMSLNLTVTYRIGMLIFQMFGFINAAEFKALVTERLDNITDAVGDLALDMDDLQNAVGTIVSKYAANQDYGPTLTKILDDLALLKKRDVLTGYDESIRSMLALLARVKFT